MEVDQLTGAVVSGDTIRVRHYLDKGVCKNFRDLYGEPLLMKASGNIETIRLLLERGANPNATNARGWNPIQCAARNGPLELVQLWTDHGARVRPNIGEESALHHASYFGHADIVALLLEHGAGADVNDNGEMGPLAHFAAKHGQLKILEMLVNAGADLETKCSWGWSVMQWLLGEGSSYVVQGKPSNWGMGHQQKEVALFLLERVSFGPGT